VAGLVLNRLIRQIGTHKRYQLTWSLEMNLPTIKNDKSSMICDTLVATDATEQIAKIERQIASTELPFETFLPPRKVLRSMEHRRHYNAVWINCIWLTSISAVGAVVMAVLAPRYSLSIATYWLGHAFGLCLACRASLEVMRQTPP